VSASFNCLAVETATEVCSIAVCRGEQTSVLRYKSARGSSEGIYESVQKLLDELDLQLDQLDCIAFGRGPGGFTGLRVGAAVAQSLAYGTGLPVCPVSSLATLAAGALRRQGAGNKNGSEVQGGAASLVATCLDARMGEAYVALYARDEAEIVRLQLEDRLVDPREFEFESGPPFLAVGPGWAAFDELRERHAPRFAGTDFEWLPSAEDLLVIARHNFDAGRTVPAAEALPNYVRDKVTQ
jgi:tRNA threonylcarbamoyladenosine biosynthesis protein TsaB